MNWNSPSVPERARRLSNWHSWFAWFPVWCLGDQRTAWLETVKRRADGCAGGRVNYSYRLHFPVAGKV